MTASTHEEADVLFANALGQCGECTPVCAA